MSEKQEHTNPQQQSPYQGYPQYYPQASPAYYPAAYNYRQFSQMPPQTPAGTQLPAPGPGAAAPAQNLLPMEQSYIENILRLNIGKLANVHMTFEGRREEVFHGFIEGAGRDHIILRDAESNNWYLLLMIYLDYVSFGEKINYQYTSPFAPGTLSTFPPR